MTETRKVYIKGVPDRGAEVIKMLEDLGAVNHWDYTGDSTNGIYYIRHDGYIGLIGYKTEFAQIIIDNYRELHLPEQWHDGDVIAYVGNPQKFAVCAGVEDNQYGEVMTRFVVDEERLEMRASVK